MPGENLDKLSRQELRQLRDIVRKEYGLKEGLTKEMVHQFLTDRECDKLIDALLPSTVEALRENGESAGFLNSKKFFLPSRIVGADGKAMLKEDA